jgi:dolichyl-phosphate beta-glucosyltransferase
MQKTVIVVPCFNEAARIVADDFVAAVKQRSDLKLLFVDDGSTDDTSKILEDLCGQHSQAMSFMRLHNNSGKAEAVRRGMLKAFADDVAVVGYWDADLSTPFAELDPMLDTMTANKAAIVIGSRVRLLGNNIARSMSRHYLGRAFATAASLVLRLPVYDTQCGAKLFVNTNETRSLFESPFDSRWIFDVEILSRSQRITPPLVVVEHPLSNWNHTNGSRLRPTDFINAGLDLVRLGLTTKKL